MQKKKARLFDKQIEEFCQAKNFFGRHSQGLWQTKPGFLANKSMIFVKQSQLFWARNGTRKWNKKWINGMENQEQDIEQEMEQEMEQESQQ